MTALADADGVELDIPERESDEYYVLAAWYGNFGFFENYRKIVLAACREATRAKQEMEGGKIVEARLDSLQRLHPAYLDFLRRHLEGRQMFEKAYLAQGGLR